EHALGSSDLLESRYQMRKDRLQGPRVGLHDRVALIKIDHDAGESVAFTVDQAIAGDAALAERSSERESVLDSSPKKRRIWLFLAREDAHGDRRLFVPEPVGLERAGDDLDPLTGPRPTARDVISVDPRV